MLVLQAVAAIGRRWPACHIFAALSGTLHFLGASNPSFRDFQQSSFVFRERLLGETLAFFRVSPVLRGVLHGTSPLVIFYLFCQQVGTASVPLHLSGSRPELSLVYRVKAYCVEIVRCT